MIQCKCGSMAINNSFSRVRCGVPSGCKVVMRGAWAGLDIACAWCGRYRQPGKTWVHFSTRFDRSKTSHTICPECAKKYIDELKMETK
jgi:hypothetical protein